MLKKVAPVFLKPFQLSWQDMHRTQEVGAALTAASLSVESWQTLQLFM
jgi:hypothetical protein